MPRVRGEGSWRGFVTRVRHDGSRVPKKRSKHLIRTRVTNKRHEHVYVYAIVGGWPKPRILSALPTLPDGAPPRAVQLNPQMSLVIADVPSAIYSAAFLEARLKDLDWVSRCGAAHHAVSDTLVEFHAVLPFRFFTLFSSEAKAVATLRKSKARLAHALARVKGRHEWVLRIGKPDPSRVSSPGQSDRTHAASGTTFLRAKADASRAQIERAVRIAAEAVKTFEALRTLSDAATTRPIEPGTNLLLDAAFLVPKRRTSALEPTLTEAASDLLRDGCPVSLTGPWPPYSFASLE